MKGIEMMRMNKRLVVIFVFGMLVLASIQLASAASQTWHLTDDVIGTAVTADHVVISEVCGDNDGRLIL
ncbi:MAG: hypothetical protein U9N41_07485 [Euryarchaeota archaeon]|nr:hypothetical protein [Euryarchaeota archaeon]